MKFKSYKIDVSVWPYLSEAVQKHAFTLGYAWGVDKEKLVQYTASKYLFFYGKHPHIDSLYNCIVYDDDNIGFTNVPEISAIDFLKLTKEDVIILEEKTIDWLKPLRRKSGEIVHFWFNDGHQEYPFEVVFGSFDHSSFSLPYKKSGAFNEIFYSASDLENFVPEKPWFVIHNKEKTKAHFFYGKWEITRAANDNFFARRK